MAPRFSASFRIGGMDQHHALRTIALESRDAIELLAEKWRITILHLLRNGPLRTRDLQSAVEQISPKMLTQTLRGMERDGLLIRKVRPVAPPHVEYELTGMGLSLIPPLQTLCLWAKSHVAERDAARRQFDVSAMRAQESLRAPKGK
jgi:DNA-binding HxlR family transcriptional regulator